MASSGVAAVDRLLDRRLVRVVDLGPLAGGLRRTLDVGGRLLVRREEDEGRQVARERLLRLLDLNDHVAVGEDGGGLGDDPGPGAPEILVGEAGAPSGACLHLHDVAAGDVFARRHGGQPVGGSSFFMNGFSSSIGRSK